MIREKFSLSGKAGIVTGASRGLGRGMAGGLADMGADLVIAARGVDQLEKTAASLRVYGGSVLPVATDVGDDDELARLVDTACKELGDIDFVVCNAGIIRRGPSHEHAVDDFDDVYLVNVRSVFQLARLAANVMIERGHGGSIILVDSVVSRHGSRAVPGYVASKGAVNALIRALANDWGQYGIRVNGIGPGFCETDMTEGIRSDPDRFGRLSERMALGRWGRPEDMAGAAVYLASDASAYVTGTTIYVDGGFLGM